MSQTSNRSNVWANPSESPTAAAPDAVRQSVLQVSVVVATFNRRDSVLQLVRQLDRQDFPREKYEIVVVSDGSSDGTAEALRSADVGCALSVIEQQNSGLASARNRAANAARGELILFLDDDIRCGQDLVRRHWEAHQRLGSDCIVAGPVRDGPKTRDSAAFRLQSMFAQRNEQSVAAVARGDLHPLVSRVGLNCSLDRRRLLCAGGFNERLRNLEDVELGMRVERSGSSFAFEPAAAVEHDYVKDPESFVRSAENLARASVVVSNLYPEYRPYSGIAALRSGSMSKQILREALVRSGQPLDESLARLQRANLPTSIAEALLRLRTTSAFWRTVRRELGSWEALRDSFGTRLTVVAYHHVGAPVAGSWHGLTVTAGKFRQHLDWMSQLGFTPIKLDDWLLWRRGLTKLPAKPVLITFDDAYAETAETAFPMLAQLGIPAMVFVVTGLTGATSEWMRPALPLMNIESIRKWAARGIEFGSHTRTHRNLASAGPECLEDEIAGSATDLEKITGRRPRAFAFPYATESEASRHIVEREYDVAFLVGGRINYIQTEPHRLHRVEPHPGDGFLAFSIRMHIGRIPALTKLFSKSRWQ